MAKTKGAPAWPGASLWPIDKIKPYPKNTRTHPPEQVTLLARLFLKFGPDQPIVASGDRQDYGVILKGHGRRLGAIEAGLEEFPVVLHVGLSDADKEAMRIGDNAVGLLSGWDTQLMRLAVGELKTIGYDLELLALGDNLSKYLPAVPDAKDPDAIPDPPKQPIVRLGDVWELGEHKIICGDSTDKKVWDRLLGHQRAAMTFTDPPYGVSYEARAGDFAVIEGDHKRRDDLFKMLVGAFQNMVRVCAAEAGFYIWHASGTRSDFMEALTRVGLRENQYLIWAKPSIGLGYSDYRWDQEPCFYASRAGKKPAFYGEPNQGTVWRIGLRTGDGTAAVIGPGLVILSGTGQALFIQPKVPKAKKLREVRITDERPTVHIADDTGTGTVWEVARDRDYKHPTQKPVELALRAINNSSKRGEIVAEAFSGSGTTIMAAEMTGRRCYAIELDPKYVQVAIERWQEFTGKAATLDSVPFGQVTKQRKGKGNAKGDSGKSVRGGKRPARSARPVAKRPVREAMPPG